MSSLKQRLLAVSTLIGIMAAFLIPSFADGMQTCPNCGYTGNKADWKFCNMCGTSLHIHTWQEATCTQPKSCTSCGVTEGDKLGHRWMSTKAQTSCTLCGTNRYLMNFSAETWTTKDSFIWGQKTYRRGDVSSVVFTDDISRAPNDAWSVSSLRDRSILAWMEDGCLTIASEGIIAANPNSSWLFADFCNMKSINFNNRFDTSFSTNMNAMFAGCEKLEQVDLSSFDTSKVTDMGGMFNDCNALKAVNVSSFNTEKVRYFSWMFGRNYMLSRVELSGFDFSRCLEMPFMFYYCQSLEEVKLSNLIAPKMTKLSSFSEGCTRLKNIEVSQFSVGKNVEATNFMVDGGTINGKPWKEFFK